MAFATVNLNMIQCLLQVIPNKNKTLSISFYTILVTLSNAFMPMVGVLIYTKLGANLAGLQTTFGIIFVLRIVSTGFCFLGGGDSERGDRRVQFTRNDNTNKKNRCRINVSTMKEGKK